MINDIEALSAPGALAAIARSDCAVCLCTSRASPPPLQRDPHYDDVVGEVKAFLEQRVKAARDAGIAADRIVVGPRLRLRKDRRA
jgi:dihydropteroate synthase